MFSRYLNQSLDFLGQKPSRGCIVRMVNDVEIVSDQLINAQSMPKRANNRLVLRRLLDLNSRLLSMHCGLACVFSVMISFLGKKNKMYSRRYKSSYPTFFNVEEVLNSMKIVQAFSTKERNPKTFGRSLPDHFRLWSKLLKL
jgi:ABC-type multidrug transport system fused ATPase/permease subunit